MDAQRFSAIAQFLRKHAPTLLDNSTATGKEDLSTELSDHVTFFENASATSAGTAVLSQRQKAWRMISCIFLKGHVKSTHKMPDVVREAVGVALPAEAESGDLQSMGMAVGGRTQREQATFCLDLAYCLVWRHQTRNASRAKWAWQDSSPQGMFNWLITRYKWCELRVGPGSVSLPLLEPCVLNIAGLVVVCHWTPHLLRQKRCRQLWLQTMELLL